jgi:rhizosphere induced protein
VTVPATYSVTVVNDSELDPPASFALFAAVPGATPNPIHALAWQVTQLNPGNRHVFSWAMTWAFAYTATAVTPGYQWSPEGTLAADPIGTATCAASLGWDGDCTMAPATGQPDGTTLWVTDAATVPLPTVQPTSVGLALGGAPACATDAGPNLHQTFTLAPAWYIDDDRYVAGQVVDAATLAQCQPLTFPAGVTALTATLEQDNTWTVVPTATVDLSRPWPRRRTSRSPGTAPGATASTPGW